MDSNIDRVLATIHEDIRKKNKLAGLLVQTKIRDNITHQGLVDTGRYRNTITSRADQDGFIVGSNVPYAIWLELGTRYIRPYAPIRKGLMASLPELQRIYAQEIA